MSLCKTYGSQDVIVLVADIEINSGRAKGAFCKVTYEADENSDDVGADGEVVRYSTNDKRGSFVLTLMQTSNGNDVLSTLLERDRAAKRAGTGGVRFAVSVTDLQGRSLHRATSAWIQKPADAEYGAESKEREWTIRAAELISFIGGNQELA